MTRYEQEQEAGLEADRERRLDEAARQVEDEIELDELANERRIGELLESLRASFPPMPASEAGAQRSPFYTPSGRYFASAADAAFWTKVDEERAARYAERVAAHQARARARKRAA